MSVLCVCLCVCVRRARTFFTIYLSAHALGCAKFPIFCSA